MKIKTKFDIGDMVYCVDFFNRLNVCDICEGMGNIEDTRLEEYSCPKCQGTGSILRHLMLKVIGPYKIIGCSIHRGEMIKGFSIEDCEEKYYLDNLDSYTTAPNIIGMEYNVKKPNIFKTKESAQVYCKNANRRKKS